jgi:hypothetical protein
MGMNFLAYVGSSRVQKLQAEYTTGYRRYFMHAKLKHDFVDLKEH